MAAKYKICPFCSHKIKTTTTFCIHCGKDLRSIEFIESNNVLIAKNNIKEQPDDFVPEPLSKNPNINEDKVKYEDQTPLESPKLKSEDENLPPKTNLENIIHKNAVPTTVVVDKNTELKEANAPAMSAKENSTIPQRKNPFSAFNNNTFNEEKNTDVHSQEIVKTDENEKISETSEPKKNNSHSFPTTSKAAPKAFTLEIPVTASNSSNNVEHNEEKSKEISNENISNLTNKEFSINKTIETSNNHIKDQFEPETEEIEDVLEDSMTENVSDSATEQPTTEKTHFTAEHSQKYVFEKEPEPELDNTEEPEDIFFLDEETIREEPYDARKDGYYEDVEAEVEEEIKRTMSDSTKKTILAISLSIVSVIIYAYWKGYI